MDSSLQKQATCECGATFTMKGVDIMGTVLWPTRYCPECIERKEIELQSRESDKLREEREKAWKDICPPLFQKTDLSKLNLTEEVKQSVLKWEFNPTGILLIGPSRTGKTRLMFELMKNLHMRGRNTTCINASELSDEVASLFGESAKAAVDFVKRLEGSNVLFIDDLGKDRLTERAETALYRILDHRLAYERPTFFTSNATGSTLRTRLTEERADPIINRIREMTQTIVL